MSALRIKKGDLVKIIAGAHKGTTGKVVKADAKTQKVFIENIGMKKRHIKPSQLNTRGGTKEVHTGISISNVALIIDEAKGKTSRVAFGLTKEGTKTRVAKATKKEIA